MKEKKLSYKPLYKQIYEILYQRITNSIYNVGGEIPPEKSLAEEFDVSISTIRQAVGLLVEDGFLVRKQGKGTFVTNNPITLKFLGWIGEMQEGERVIEHIIDIFENKNQNIKIEYINKSYEDIKSTYLNMVQSGQSPDIIQIDNYWTSSLASMGLLESLDDIIPVDNLSGRFSDKDLKGGMYNGELFSVAWGLGPSSLIYNKKLVERFEIDLSNELTFKEYFQICKNISKHPQNNGVKPFGLAKNIDIIYNIYSFLVGFEADIVDDNNNIVLDSNSSIEAFEYLSKLVQENQVVWVNDVRELRKLIAENKIVFLEDGPWIRGILKELTDYDNKIDEYFGVINNPANKLSRYSSFTRNHNLAISSMCDRKDVAIKFLDALTSDPEICNLYFKELGLLPPQKELLMSHSYSDHVYYSTFINQMEKAKVLNGGNPLFMKALKFVSDASYNILYKKANIEGELKEKAYYLRMLYSE